MYLSVHIMQENNSSFFFRNDLLLIKVLAEFFFLTSHKKLSISHHSLFAKKMVESYKMTEKRLSRWPFQS